MPKLAILVSGNGSNLQAIIDAIAAGHLACQISVVIADRECYALARAKAAGVAHYLIERKIYRSDVFAEINKYVAADCDLIILAGFLSILDSDFIRRWPQRIINLHPSLLPKFGGAGMWGLNVHRAVIAAAETISGCSIHYVTPEIDGGEIIMQKTVAVSPHDTAESLQQKVQRLEAATLVAVIKQLLNLL